MRKSKFTLEQIIQALWRNTDMARGHLSLSLLDERTVYLGYGWYYAAFDLATGRVRWRTPPGDYDPQSPLQGKPVVAADRLFIAGRDGSYAIAKEW